MSNSFLVRVLQLPLNLSDPFCLVLSSPQNLTLCPKEFCYIPINLRIF